MRTDGQCDSGAGLEAQRRAITAACKRRGWQLLELVEDAGLSPKDGKRPGIEEALRVLESADAKALVAAKRDTLTQALLDLAALLAAAQKQPSPETGGACLGQSGEQAIKAMKLMDGLGILDVGVGDDKPEEQLPEGVILVHPLPPE